MKLQSWAELFWAELFHPNRRHILWTSQGCPEALRGMDGCGWMGGADAASSPVQWFQIISQDKLNVSVLHQVTPENSLYTRFPGYIYDLL